MAHYVRLARESSAQLNAMAEDSGRTTAEIAAEAIDALFRRRFLAKCNSAYARLRQNRRSWEAYRSELRAWDATLADGLE